VATSQAFDQVLPKNAILARGQFGHGLRDGLNHFIRLFGVDFI
jgi:hypothetical protein